MVNESHYARMPLFKASVPACLGPSLHPSRSLSLPPRWSSQLGWMRLISNSSCANGSLARRECSMHSNLSHRLIYSPSLTLSLALLKRRGGGGCFVCQKMHIFLQGSFSDFSAVFLGYEVPTAGFSRWKMRPAALTHSRLHLGKFYCELTRTGWAWSLFYFMYFPWKQDHDVALAY